MREIKIPMVYTRYRVVTGAVRNFVDELNYCPHCNNQSRSLDERWKNKHREMEVQE